MNEAFIQRYYSTKSALQSYQDLSSAICDINYSEVIFSSALTHLNLHICDIDISPREIAFFYLYNGHLIKFNH